MRKGLNWAFVAVMAVTPCAYFAAKIFRQFGVYPVQWNLNEVIQIIAFLVLVGDSKGWLGEHPRQSGQPQSATTASKHFSRFLSSLTPRSVSAASAC